MEPMLSTVRRLPVTIKPFYTLYLCPDCGDPAQFPSQCDNDNAHPDIVVLPMRVAVKLQPVDVPDEVVVAQLPSMQQQAEVSSKTRSSK